MGIRIGKAALLAVLAGASACATAEAGKRGEAAALPADAVAMETRSWGVPISGWEIRSDGEGEYRRTERPGPSFHDYDIVVRRFSAGAEGFAQIRELLRPVERYAGREIPCRIVATDGPYGTLSWRNSEATASLSYNFFCRSSEAERVYALLGQAETIVSGWVEGLPPDEVREVRHPQ